MAEPLEMPKSSKPVSRELAMSLSMSRTDSSRLHYGMSSRPLAKDTFAKCCVQPNAVVNRPLASIAGKRAENES